MKNQFNLLGSIEKKEVLVPIESNILVNTFVCEASNPYANYYGQLPQKAKPNSLFLFTHKFYFLEEILSSTKQFEKCLLDEINIASAIITFDNKQYPAIRIKNFPDYTRLSVLQSCLIEHGIELTPKLKIKGEVNTRINKLFVLEEVEQKIFMDLVEDHKGYFIHENRISTDDFEQIITSITNSSGCKLFDAVQGKIFLDGKVVEIIRVFAERLDFDFLIRLQKEFTKRLTNNTIV